MMTVCTLLFPGLPKLKKVVIVPYVKSAGDDGLLSTGNVKNGLAYFTPFCVTFYYQCTIL